MRIDIHAGVMERKLRRVPFRYTDKQMAYHVLSHRGRRGPADVGPVIPLPLRIGCRLGSQLQVRQ